MCNRSFQKHTTTLLLIETTSYIRDPAVFHRETLKYLKYCYLMLSNRSGEVQSGPTVDFYHTYGKKKKIVHVARKNPDSLEGAIWKNTTRPFVRHSKDTYKNHQNRRGQEHMEEHSVLT